MNNLNYRLKVSKTDYARLRELTTASFPNESGAFALAGVSRQGDTTDILIRRVIKIPSEMFDHQSKSRLEIAPRAINGIIALAEANGSGVVICHSHPVDSPYSPSDNYGEKRIQDTLRDFIPARAPVASLLVHPNGVRGRIWINESRISIPLDEIVIVGPCYQRIRYSQNADTSNFQAEYFDRQVKAFGREGQEAIRRMKTAIVGVGGTGSAVAEQVSRIGVSDLVLIDHDILEPSNLSRIYGSFQNSLRRHWYQLWQQAPKKVDVVADHLRRINPEMKIKKISRSIVYQDVATAITDRDVVFLCTDDHWGRSVVNELCYQYLIPTINMGVRIGSTNEGITSGAGVIDILRPHLACLWCKKFLDSSRIAAESLPERERVALENEGYIERLSSSQPSVVSLTTTVAGLAVTQFLQFATNFMGDKGSISRLNYDIMSGTISRGITQVSSDCICTEVKGYGDLRELNVIR